MRSGTCLIGRRGSPPARDNDQAGFGDDLMNTLIVGLTRDGIDDLEIVGDANAMRFAVRMCQQAIIVTAAATDTESFTRKCESGNEDDIERRNFDGLAMRFGFPDVHLATLKIVHAFDLTRSQFVRVDLKTCQAGSLLP